MRRRILEENLPHPCQMILQQTIINLLLLSFNCHKKNARAINEHVLVKSISLRSKSLNLIFQKHSWFRYIVDLPRSGRPSRFEMSESVWIFHSTMARANMVNEIIYEPSVCVISHESLTKMCMNENLANIGELSRSHTTHDDWTWTSQLSTHYFVVQIADKTSAKHWKTRKKLS